MMTGIVIRCGTGIKWLPFPLPRHRYRWECSHCNQHGQWYFNHRIVLDQAWQHHDVIQYELAVEASNGKLDPA